MMYAVPAMLLMGFLTWLWLQIMYMGLFRPSSKDAQAINIGTQGEKVAASVIAKKYKELGPITWYESIVGFLFVTVVLLWFFRKPGFIEGWPSYITDLYESYPSLLLLFSFLLYLGDKFYFQLQLTQFSHVAFQNSERLHSSNWPHNSSLHHSIKTGLHTCL